LRPVCTDDPARGHRPASGGHVTARKTPPTSFSPPSSEKDVGVFFESDRAAGR
jgi:hypothetical protein